MGSFWKQTERVGTFITPEKKKNVKFIILIKK